jgi:hypothetical protein
VEKMTLIKELELTPDETQWLKQLLTLAGVEKELYLRELIANRIEEPRKQLWVKISDCEVVMHGLADYF